jgi:hypothetical protein
MFLPSAVGSVGSVSIFDKLFPVYFFLRRKFTEKADRAVRKIDVEKYINKDKTTFPQKNCYKKTG